MTKANKIIGGVVIAAILLIGASNGLSFKRFTKKVNRIEAKYQAEIAEINMEKDSLKSYNDSIDKVLDYKTYIADSLYKVDLINKQLIAKYKKDLIDAWNEIFDNDIDENYAYLQDRYPTEDTLKYPFAGDQVTNMAADIVKGDYLDSINRELERNDVVLRQRILNHLSTIQVLKENKQDADALIASLYDRLATKTKEQKITEEEAERLRKVLRQWQAGSISFLAAILILALLL